MFFAIIQILSETNVFFPKTSFTLNDRVNDRVMKNDVKIDLAAPPEQVRAERFWQTSVGSGHAKLGLRTDWQIQLMQLNHDTKIRGVRFHGTFDDDMGPVVYEADDGAIKYNWTLVDSLYDAILRANVKPIIELSFMPRVLLTKLSSYKRFRASSPFSPQPTVTHLSKPILEAVAPHSYHLLQYIL